MGFVGARFKLQLGALDGGQLWFTSALAAVRSVVVVVLVRWLLPVPCLLVLRIVEG